MKYSQAIIIACLCASALVSAAPTVPTLTDTSIVARTEGSTEGPTDPNSCPVPEKGGQNVPRGYYDDGLDARDYEFDEELAARGWYDEDLEARDYEFDEELAARGWYEDADELEARDFYDELDARSDEDDEPLASRDYGEDSSATFPNIAQILQRLIDVFTPPVDNEI